MCLTCCLVLFFSPPYPVFTHALIHTQTSNRLRRTNVPQDSDIFVCLDCFGRYGHEHQNQNPLCCEKPVRRPFRYKPAAEVSKHVR